MKYNLLHKEQGATRHLLADTFGSILGMDLHTSVVNPLPEMLTGITGFDEHNVIRPRRTPYTAFIVSYASDKAFVS